MKNQVQQGDAIYVTAPSGGFTSGLGYQVGAALFGIAGATVTVGNTGVLWVVGVFTLPKLSTDAWGVGDIIYWDNTANQWCTKTAASNLRIGVAVAANLATTTIGTIRLVAQ
jgi:predicted RecA/RadA family phage recombinase